jgi:hypothetical protein
LKYKKFDIIIAQNVFAHISYPIQFLKLCKQLLSDTGILFIQTSQKNMISLSQFDTAYHEHLSFFNTNSMRYACNLNTVNMNLNNVNQVNIHGGSYLFEIQLEESKGNTIDVLSEEMNDELYCKNTYDQYRYNCLIYKNNFHTKILGYLLQTKILIGVGSTAKSNTLLNFCGISNEIDCIIDENKLKQNLLTPGSNILITDFSRLKTIKCNTILILMAWNFELEILEKINKKLQEYNITFPIEVLNINTLKTKVINNGLEF